MKAALISVSMLFTTTCYSQCPGYSWITELHARRLGINCRSAQKQIDEIVLSIQQALISSRQVDIQGLGSFGVSPKLKSGQITFKTSKELLFKLKNKPEK